MYQVPGIASGDSREKDKETENEYSYYDGDMDRPWEEETEKGRERAREEDEDDPDFYRKYLVLTPANLGCMPPADDEVSEPQRGAGAGLGTAQPSNQKARGQGQYWEEGEQGREKEKYKENPRLEDVATAEGDAHYVRQSTTSVAFMGESSQGARRAASGMHAPSGAEESLDTGYLRQQQGIGYSRADSHAEEFSTSNALRDLSRAAWGTGAGPSAGAVPAPAPDTSQVLNYESAGYNQKSVFEGTNSMVMALETRVSTPLPERQVTPKQSTHGY